MANSKVIVVTGSRGFLGSIFSLRAVERGHKVIALDNESRGLNPIADKIGDAYHVHDCENGFDEAVRVVHKGAVDIVAHFAAATGSLERPLDELRELNVEMTQAVYEDALHYGAEAFLWPTTSLAIGVPDSPYVISKEEGLARLKEVDAHAQISIPLRFFNVAGAYKGLTELRKNEVHCVPLLLEAYRKNEPFVINGDDYDTADGTPSRDFVNVVDVVDYLLDLALAKCKGEEALARIAQPHEDGAIWLGKGHSTTVRQMTEIFEQYIGPVQTRIGPRRAYDCGALIVDERQARQFRAQRGGLVPAWVSIRDELAALQDALIDRSISLAETEIAAATVSASTLA